MFLQGGIGLHTAAGAVAAGAAGVVLDVHLTLTEDSAVRASLKDFLRGLGFPATVTLAEQSANPLRVYSRVGTKIVRALKKTRGVVEAGRICRIPRTARGGLGQSGGCAGC